MKPIILLIITYCKTHKTSVLHRKIHKKIKRLMPKCHKLYKRLQEAANSETGVDAYGLRYLAELEIALKQMQDAYRILDRNKPFQGLYDALDRLEYYCIDEKNKKH